MVVVPARTSNLRFGARNSRADLWVTPRAARFMTPGLTFSRYERPLAERRLLSGTLRLDIDCSRRAAAGNTRCDREVVSVVVWCRTPGPHPLPLRAATRREASARRHGGVGREECTSSRPEPPAGGPSRPSHRRDKGLNPPVSWASRSGREPWPVRQEGRYKASWGRADRGETPDLHLHRESQ